MRIVSLLPSATEICFALGLGDQLVGVSHECDFPPEAATKTVVTRATVVDQTMSSAAIDAAVTRQIGSGDELYGLDLGAITRLAPDLILTQELCAVCAISLPEVQALAASLPTRPMVVSLDPYSLADVLGNVEQVGAATGQRAAAEKLVGWLQTRLDLVEAATENLARRPKVFCLEWLDPPWIAGHWVPEMVALAGGDEVFGAYGQPSQRATWADIAAREPDVLVAIPCGFDVERGLHEIDLLAKAPEFYELPATKRGEIYVVNGSAYFNRPGPRLVDGVELLAQLFHTGLLTGLIPEDAVARATWRSGDAIPRSDLAAHFTMLPPT